MARKLIVEIIADPSGFTKGLGQATKTTTTFTGSLKGMGKTALLAGGAAGVAAEGVHLLFDVMGKSITAAEDAEKAHALVNQAFKNAGLSAAGYAKQIDKAGKSALQLGFDDEAAQVSLAKFVTAGQSVSQAMREVSIAEDLARAKNITLESATQILVTSMAGQTRALKALGIAYVPTTQAVDALKAAHAASKTEITANELATAKLADKQANAANVMNLVAGATRGQAQAFSETAAGGMAQFHQQIQNIEEAIGQKLLPVMTSVVSFVNDNWATIGTVISEVFAVSKIAIESFIFPMRVLWDLLHGDWGGAWDALKAPAVACWDAIKGALQPLINMISGPLTNAMNAIRNTFASVWESIRSVVSGAVDAVRGALGSLASFVEGRASAVWNGLRGAVSSALSGLGSIATNAFNAFVNAIEGAAKSAFNAAKKVGEAVLDGIRSVINAIKIPGIHLSIPYPTVSISYSSVDTHLPGIGTVSIPTGVSLGIGHAGFDIPGFDPIGNFAQGGQIPGQSGPVPIMAHAGEFVLTAAATKKLGLGFLHSLNSFASGGLVGDSEYAAALRKKHGPWEPPRRWAPDEMRTGAVYRGMLERRFGSLIHFEDAWVQALYGASNRMAIGGGLALQPPPVSISDATSGQVWYDFPGGQYKIPSFASGGVMPYDGLARLHRGETVTPAGAANVIHVYVGEKEVAAIIQDSIVENGRRGGPIAARVPS